MTPVVCTKLGLGDRLARVVLWAVLACGGAVGLLMGSFWLSLQRMEWLERSVGTSGWIGMTRAQFESRFPDLSGTVVPFTDIPRAFGVQAADYPSGSIVVRYRFLWCASHVVYDANGRLKLYVPTYE
jgi:hypothetical protein